MNDYSFIFLDFRIAFMRPYIALAPVHDVKYIGAVLDKFRHAADIKLRKKTANNKDESSGNKIPRDRGKTIK